jgi:hypothetical protein
VLRLSSAAMQPSIACASPGACVQEQSTCALLLLHHDAERHGLHVTRCAGAHASSCGLAEIRQSSCQSATCAHTRVQLYAASSPPR